MRKGTNFTRKKETKARALKKGCGRQLFIEQFGRPIEDFASFKRATEASGARTKLSFRRVLPAYFLFLGENPDVVIANRKADLASPDALDVERYERKTKAYIKMLIAKGRVVSGHLGRIHGFYTNNSHRLSLDLRQFKYPKARKKRKYSPTNEDVRQLISYADSARDKFIITVGYQNGALPIDISGLCIGDYPVVAWQCFEKNRSKTGEIWRGISTPDACESLKAYMVMRKGADGEPLLVGREGPLNSEGISQAIHVLIEKAGLSKIPGFTPKCLRDGFEDALVDAEIYHKVKEALMGHTVDIEHEYGSYKKMVERLVDAVKKTYPLICLNDANKVVSGLNMDKLNVLMERFDDFIEIADLAKEKKLLNLDDPLLLQKLKDAGVIK